MSDGLWIDDLLANGEARFGPLWGSLRDRVADLCPVSPEVWAELLAGDGRSWRYVLAVLQAKAGEAPSATPQPRRPRPIEPMTRDEQDTGLAYCDMVLRGLGVPR